jgi:hypothetical protein
VYLAREVQNAIEAATRAAAAASSQVPTAGSSDSAPFQFGQQQTPGMAPPPPSVPPPMPSPGARVTRSGQSYGNVSDNPPNENNNTAQQPSRKRQAPSSFTARQARRTATRPAVDVRQAEPNPHVVEHTHRAAALDTREKLLNTREILLNQREERLNRESQELQQRQQDSTTTTERARLFQMSRDAQAQVAQAQRDASAPGGRRA